MDDGEARRALDERVRQQAQLARQALIGGKTSKPKKQTDLTNVFGLSDEEESAETQEVIPGQKHRAGVVPGMRARRPAQLMEEQASSVAQPPRSSVVAPSDPELLQVIHNLVTFVQQHGREFEQAVLARNQQDEKFNFLRFPGSPEHLYYLQCLGPAAWPVSSDRDGISDDKDSFDDGGFGEKCLEDNDSDEDFPTPTSSKPSHHAVPPPAFQNNAVPPPAFQNNAVRPPAFQTNAVRPPAFPHIAPPPVHPSSAVPPPVLRSAATPPPLHPPPSSQGQILVGGAPPLPPGRPAVAAAPGLGILSVTQLRAIAASRGIDLSDCVEKKDMVAKLTGGLAAAQSASSPESVVSPIPTPSATPPAEPAAASAERSQRPRQSRWSIGPPENSPSAQPFAAIPPIPPPLPSVATPPPLPPVLPSLFMAPPPLPPSSVSRMDEFVANLSRKDGDSQRSAEEIPEPKGHHMEHFLPDHERKKFAMAAKGIRNFDDEKAKLQDDNKGHQLLSKMGWSEGTGLGKKRKGISVPIQAKGSAVGSAGIGACTGQVEVSPNDDMFTMYKKRIALAYRFRPNPLGNPRKEYWTDPNMNAGATKDY